MGSAAAARKGIKAVVGLTMRCSMSVTGVDGNWLDDSGMESVSSEVQIRDDFVHCPGGLVITYLAEPLRQRIATTTASGLM